MGETTAIEWTDATSTGRALFRDACESEGTAFFLKQLGGHPDKRGDEKAVLDGRRHTDMPFSMVVA